MLQVVSLVESGWTLFFWSGSVFSWFIHIFQILIDVLSRNFGAPTVAECLVLHLADGHL